MTEPQTPTQTPVPEDLEEAPVASRVSLQGRTLREHTARGTVINAAFQIGLQSLGLVKGLVVAAFLTRTEYGIWGILLITLGTLGWLRQVGVSDKYVQQSEPDQEVAFQKAFSVETVFTAAFFAVSVPVVFLASLVYGREDLIAPGLAVTLLAPLSIFTVPVWCFYRRMEFVRQRALAAVDPVVSFVVTLALAIAGAGYWSLVIGALAGTAALAVSAVAVSPYRLRFRVDRDTLRTYTSFSWPLFAASLSAVVIAQGGFIVGEHELGIAAAGAMALAAAISTYADRVDEVITQTLYPAICAVRDRTELLFESFVKSNRLALMWGFPFGVGMALFADDLVRFVLGARWEPAVVVIQIFGLNAAFNHIGFNWHAFYRAQGNTRPVAVWAFLNMLAFLAAVPALIVADGLRGFGLGMSVVVVVSLVVKAYYLTRLFPGFAMLRHALRAIAPTLPAVAAVLGARLVESGHRSLGLALAELTLYLAVTAGATWLFERALLREVAGYLRGRDERPLEMAT